jgi:hypothetical protein
MDLASRKVRMRNRVIRWIRVIRQREAGFLIDVGRGEALSRGLSCRRGRVDFGGARCAVARSGIP